MNDRRFKELVNLYLDHEISPEEAAELAHEVRSSIERKRTFDSYCLLQKGCTVLFENNRVNAPAHDALKRALADANHRISSPRTTHRSFWLAGGSFATLAAAAFTVFLMTKPSTPSAPSTVAVASTPVAKPAVETRTPVVLVKDARIPALFATNQSISFVTPERPVETLKWTENVQFRPIRQVDAQEIVFSKGTIQQDGSVAPTNDPLNGSPTEMTALQFKR